MHIVFAISSIIQKPIQTRWPILLCDMWESPLTKLVCGRDVLSDHPVNILWTIGAAKYTGKGSRLELNHFVPLLVKPSVVGECAVDCADIPVRVDEPEPSEVVRDDEPVQDTSEMETVDCPVADGKPLDKKFLPIVQCVQQLRADTPGLESIPTGVKDNMRFKVQLI